MFLRHGKQFVTGCGPVPPGSERDSPVTDPLSSTDLGDVLMNMARLESVWAPRLLSILRIVAALIFMAHGTQKILGFPASPSPGPNFLSLLWFAGLLEILGGALL